MLDLLGEKHSFCYICIILLMNILFNSCNVSVENLLLN